MFTVSRHAVLTAQLSTQPIFCPNLTDYATHGQTGRTAGGKKKLALATVIIFTSVPKQVHTLITEQLTTPWHALLLSLALPFICFSPHFQQIRSQYSCACASPQSGMHLEKAFSNSDWRQAGRQRERRGERESKWARELRIEWSRRRCMGRGGVICEWRRGEEEEKERGVVVVSQPERKRGESG